METVGSFRGSPIEDVISRINMLSQISTVKGLACGCYRTPCVCFVFKPGSYTIQEAALEFSLFRDQAGLKHLVVLPPLSPKYWNY